MNQSVNEQQLLDEYRSMIQFVEITFNGARLEKTTIKIPVELLQITQDSRLGDKLKATYPLFHENFSKFTKPMKEQVAACRLRYTRALSKKFGRVMLVKDKASFEREFHTISIRIEQFKREIIDILNTQIEKTKQELIDYFTPIMLENPPNHLLHIHHKSIEETEVRAFVEWLLDKEIPTAEQILNRVEFYHVYKDVTLQILQDEQFYRDIRKAFKKDHIHWPHLNQKQEELLFL
ncbi:hypothetical protein [Bacillus tuaregi]|uniref:hypothetical protein n=1 Tax=Bacillus tuaregi TaxID=1816695 RepID=UPI0008F8B0D4|nr:hypothetical protein [Bacillus tuaregi]